MSCRLLCFSGVFLDLMFCCGNISLNVLFEDTKGNFKCWWLQTDEHNSARCTYVTAFCDFLTPKHNQHVKLLQNMLPEKF